MLKDYCGVPVNDALTTAGGDRANYNGTQAWNAVNNVFNQAFNACMGTISGHYITILGIGGIGCGSASETRMCENAGWQAVNEIMFQAYPLGYVTHGTAYTYERGLLSPDGVDYYLDGWSDFPPQGPAPVWGVSPNPPPNYNNWTGAMQGAAKVNGEFASSQTLCPGAKEDGESNMPLPCAQYEPTAWTLNAPDNIMNAAKRLKSPTVSVTSSSGWAAGYDTCVPSYCCKEL